MESKDNDELCIQDNVVKIQKTYNDFQSKWDGLQAYKITANSMVVGKNK